MSTPTDATTVFHLNDGCLSIKLAGGRQQQLPESVLSHSKLLQDVFATGGSGAAPMRLSAKQVQDWLAYISSSEGAGSPHTPNHSDNTLINILQVCPLGRLCSVHSSLMALHRIYSVSMTSPVVEDATEKQLKFILYTACMNILTEVESVVHSGSGYPGR